ncbi:MAG: hypothetical protein OQL19_18345 [Gammaproteobacteria bacterium]|nr:hypothetical protein [Gammaproteobacteria bacterium]
MNWFTSLFSSGASTVIDSVGNAIDKLVTSDEEKITLKNELASSMNKFTLEMEAKSNEFEQEITKRWVSDNEHIITRLVRPLSYSFVLVVFAVVIFADGNIGEFAINQAYIPVIETLLATMTVAYFGSRGAEKTMKHFKGGK